MLPSCPPPSNPADDPRHDRYALEPGSYVMPWGPHRGERLDQLPDHFLRYVAEHNWCPHVRELAERVLTERVEELPEDDPTPSPTSAAEAMPHAIWEWDRTMRAYAAGDLDAEAVVERGLSVLKELCSAYTGKAWAEGGEG